MVSKVKPVGKFGADLHPGKIHELPKWIVTGKNQLIDYTKPDHKGGFTKYQLAKTVEDPAHARRFAQRMNQTHTKTKIVKIVNENHNTPNIYLIYTEINNGR